MRAAPLRHDALAAELAGFAEDLGAVAVEVSVEHDAVRWLSQQPGELVLALLNRQPAKVHTVKLQQIEGAQHRLGAMTGAPDQLEHREPIVIGDDGLAVDQERARWQCGRKVASTRSGSVQTHGTGLTSPPPNATDVL